jgi:hypothetical protein
VGCKGAVLSGLTITHGVALAGGAVYCQDSTLDLKYCRILDNATLPGSDPNLNGGPGGGVYCETSAVQVIGCLISGNTTGAGAVSKDGRAGAGGNGAGICGVDSDISVASSIITGNAAGAGGDSGQAQAGNGGGIYGNLLEIADSLITGNRAGRGHGTAATRSSVQGNGGGIWCAAGTIRQCTIADNVVYQANASTGVSSSSGQGAGVFCSASTKVTGSILYGNTPDQLAGYDSRNVTYCNIKMSADSSGKGITVESPRFVWDGEWVNAKDFKTAAEPNDPNAVWVQGDYHLQTTSLLLDAGDPNFVPAVGETDLAGNPRVADAAVDVGAYESRALVPLYRFQSPTPGKSFYTDDEAEKAWVIQQYPDVWKFEGTAYYVYSRAIDPNLMPVYRFWSSLFFSHFYTISEEEKNQVISLYSDVWAYEDVAFYAYPEKHQPAGTSPVYRFWSDTLVGHAYTIDAAEKDKWINESPKVWTYESIAWYAYTNAR